jgi:putative membrane protein
MHSNMHSNMHYARPMASPERDPVETIRVHQANERTLLAWLRTALGLMGFGFAIARFGLFVRQLASVEHAPEATTAPVGSSWAGVVLVVIGMLVSLAATLRYGRLRRAIERGDVGAPEATIVYVVGITVAAVGVGLTVLLARSLAQ